MRYTEKLEALEFAISCIEQLHSFMGADARHIMKRPCECDTHIRRLRDEIKTTQCALSAMAARKGKPSVKWGLRPKQTPEAKR
jgi:hypothetical protein